MTRHEVVLITGARKGIGRFLAEHFVNQGAVVEGCSRQRPGWKLPNYTHHAADVSDEAQVKKMISSIGRRHGRLDVVINNAGIAAMNPILLTPVSTVDRILATNFRGLFLVCRESAKLMKKRRYGRIINFSTVAVPMKIEGESVYAASKSAVVTFTRILARELAEWGITCNVIGPGPVATDLIDSIPPAKIDRVVSNLAIKRLGNFQDIANVVDFFVKPESDYITGQVIYLGGA
ncbi:MAG: SDR family oxidoreductase [Acidobacteria bacterium]|nr:SDR family oxidoreductase [Acidobacteriota bacterium]